MNAKLKKAKKVSVLVCCVSLLLGPIAGRGAAEKLRKSLGVKITTNAFYKGSILERVTAIHDPELGELIRQALGNSPELANDQAAKATLVKRVTEAYLQIKMLDGQIKETDKRIESPRTTEAIRTELMLVRMELETKLLTQLAELRETMKLIPEAKYKQPVEALNTWLALDFLASDSVRVFKYAKPYYERDPDHWYPTKSECRPVSVMSEAEAIRYVRDLIEDKEHFPLRLDIFRNHAGRESSEKLYEQIDQITKEMKLEMMEVDLYLQEIRGNLLADHVTLKQGKLCMGQTLVDAADYFGFFKDWNLRRPWCLPQRLSIEFDEESRDLATNMAESVRKAARELGVEQFVNIILLSGSFGQRKPVEALNSWLALDAIDDDSVCVFKYRKPYDLMGRGGHTGGNLVKLMSQEEAIAYVRNRIGTKDDLPLRVDIHRNDAGTKCSQELYRRIVQVIKDTKLETEAEINLDGETGRADGGHWLFVLREGKAYLELVGNEESDAEGKLTRIRHFIRRPTWLPFKIDIEFDHESKDLAEKIIEGGQKIAQELGVEQFVEIELKESEP